MPPKKAAPKGKAEPGKAKAEKKATKPEKGAKTTGKPAAELPISIDATIASDEADLRVQLAVSQKEQEQLSKDYEHLRDELLKARELLQASQKDAEDVLEHRQVDLELKEQRVARLEADLIAVQQAAESTNGSYQELTADYEAERQRVQELSEEVTALKAQVAEQLEEVAAGTVVAREADTLRAQLAQLQVQQAQAETDIKGFMLAATGIKELRVVLGEVWLVSLSKHQLTGPPPQLRLGNSLTLCGSKLVYLGGVPGAAGAEVRELSGLQMPALTWDPATGHRAQLQGHAAVAISRAKVLTFGGHCGPDVQMGLRMLTPELGRWEDVEVYSTSRPCMRDGCSLICRGDQVFMFGGSSQGQLLNDVWLFDLLKRQWSQMLPAQPDSATLPGPRMNAALAIAPTGPCMWMLGGSDGSCSLADLWSYDMSMALWSQIIVPGEQIVARQCHTMSVLRQYLVVHGGIHSSGQAQPLLLSDTMVLDLGAPLWDSLDGDGSPAPTQPLHTDDHCLSVASGTMFHCLRNTRGGDALGELHSLEVTLPEDISQLKAAHRSRNVIVEQLAIGATAACTAHSIALAWEAPTKNRDRITVFRLFSTSAVGLVKEEYVGTGTSCTVQELRPATEYIFSVKTCYNDGTVLWSHPQAFVTKL